VGHYVSPLFNIGAMNFYPAAAPGKSTGPGGFPVTEITGMPVRLLAAWLSAHIACCSQSQAAGKKNPAEAGFFHKIEYSAIKQFQPW